MSAHTTTLHTFITRQARGHRRNKCQGACGEMAGAGLRVTLVRVKLD